MAVNHYENFPVASWLCPARLRPAVVAIYRFARTADDIADEGDADPQTRLADLTALRADLAAAASGAADSSRWP
ncbi:MAG: squalene/phytoene synthase family protein, partial [Burkholderiaceae bacterium]